MGKHADLGRDIRKALAKCIFEYASKKGLPFNPVVLAVIGCELVRFGVHLLSSARLQPADIGAYASKVVEQATPAAKNDRISSRKHGWRSRPAVCMTDAPQAS
jgi:hypothetical protein